MAGSGNTVAMGALPAKSRSGRAPFCTVRASWDRVDVSQMVIRGRRPGLVFFSADGAGYRKSYIAAEPAR
jgi:hypothetical protein